jgi:hypothetical protein
MARISLTAVKECAFVKGVAASRIALIVAPKHANHRA